MQNKTSHNGNKALQIKLLSLFLGTLLVLAGVLARDAGASRAESAQKRLSLLGDYTEFMSALNTCKKGLEAPPGDKTETEKTVRAAVEIAEYILRRSNGTAEKTRGFLSELERYAEEGLSDGEKTAEYLSALRYALTKLTSETAQKNLLPLCEVCENAFGSVLPEKAAGTPEEAPPASVIPEIGGKELRKMAKDALAFPVSPERDRGKTPISGTAAFSTANSYAELAKVGGKTLRAARFYRAGEGKNGVPPENAAYSRLCETFAENERFICEYRRYHGNTAYFVYFPVTPEGEVDFCRPVRIGVSPSESVVTLFDSSDYYATRSDEGETHKTAKNAGSRDVSGTGERTGRASFGSFKYETVTLNGVSCRRLVYSDGSVETLTETDFFRKCGVIR